MSQATLSSGAYRNSNLFSGYYLDERVYDLDAWDCDTEAREAFAELRELWTAESDLVDSYNEDELLDSWIDEVLSILGFDTLSETTLPDGGGYTDRLLFDSASERRAAARERRDGKRGAAFDRAAALLEAKQWDTSFTTRFTEQRSYRDASHQVKYYLERTPESLQWGVLTDGKKWRLYGTKDYETETYYEVDLPELLESDSVELFKYFYVFFRPAAFRESGGTTFLDSVWAESETAAQELGEDLQDNVFTALRVLGEGFVETNSLEIDPTEGDRLTELKEQSLVLLYRLMFVLYAESRDLIDPEDPRAAEEYEENFSLSQLRHELIAEVGETATDRAFEREFSLYSTAMWGRLENLFSLIDSGNENLGIPPYNGGLFDGERHEFLTDHAVADRYLAEVIYRLSTTETDEGFVPADYADLDTRHLGTIYEGLLEHEFAIAPEDYAAVSEDGGEVWKPATEVSVAEAVETVGDGELYVVNDDGERKATGAYYTPDYVVTYIVEETVGPLVSDIETELRNGGLDPSEREYFAAFWQRVLDLRILDPAMGSGHFLTKTTGFLTEQVMNVVRDQEIQSYDEQEFRRRVSKECIYGVDVNGMAVELAKLSMWLETLAADQPLAFLDHHLKTGNSLVGSDITEVLSNGEPDEGQMTLTQAFARTRKRALEHVMDRVSELLAIDNETLEDIHSMEDIYDDIRDDPLYQRLFAMASVHTAGQFGLDIPGDAIEQLAEAIEDEDEWAKIEETEWYRNAQRYESAFRYFHWELEYPEVFFGADGERKENAGFDAVVGNPPYVRIYGDTLDDDFVEYLRTAYETAHMKFDLYVIFTQRAIELVQESGTASYIIPDKFTNAPYGEPLRELILRDTRLLSILDLREESVFKGVTVSNLVPVLKKDKESENSLELRSWNKSEYEIAGQLTRDAIVSEQDKSFRLSRSVEDVELTRKIAEYSVRFDDIFYVNWGLRTGTEEKTEKYIVENTDSPKAHPMIRGQDITDRYRLKSPSEYIIYEKEDFYNPMFEELFENDKIVFRKISGQGLMAVADENEYYCFSTLIPCVNIQDVRNVDRAGIPDTTSESKKYQDIYYPLSIVNSSLIEWFYKTNLSDELSVVPNHINELPIAQIDTSLGGNDQSKTDDLVDDALAVIDGERNGLDEFVSDCFNCGSDIAVYEVMSELGRQMTKLHQSHLGLNLDLPDYLGTYTDGPTLGECNYQPPSGLSSSVLTETGASSEFENLRVTAARVEREGGVVRVRLVPYVKPAAGAEYETNSRGYATLDPVPAMEFFDLSDAQAALIEAFVPYAVAEAGGFAGYRDNATATISPLDRLENLTLPVLSDVEGGIERYMDARDRAAELDAKIEKTDALIDEIVYELYGLTDEEIEIVEEAVGE